MPSCAISIALVSASFSSSVRSQHAVRVAAQLAQHPALRVPVSYEYRYLLTNKNLSPLARYQLPSLSATIMGAASSIECRKVGIPLTEAWTRGGAEAWTAPCHFSTMVPSPVRQQCVTSASCVSRGVMRLASCRRRPLLRRRGPGAEASGWVRIWG